nr:MAG TPA: hypothetical protein [Caudoviricetes sp.]
MTWRGYTLVYPLNPNAHTTALLGAPFHFSSFGSASRPNASRHLCGLVLARLISLVIQTTPNQFYRKGL